MNMTCICKLQTFARTVCFGRHVNICFLILFSGLYCSSLFSADIGNEPLDNIYKAVEQYLAGQFDADAAVDVAVSPLDSRLKLQACTAPLDVFLNTNSRPQGRVTAGVRCAAPKPWTVYVPAAISIYQDVIAAARPLPRGYALTTADLKKVRINISGKRMPYYAQEDQVVGMILRRSIRSGAILLSNQLEQRNLVHRGEQVTLLAETNGLQVRMKGKALSDGAQGDVVQVKNLSSQRIVEGVVTQIGLVQVSM